MTKLTLADGSTLSFRAVKRYSFPVSKPETAGEEVDRITKTIMRETKRSYAEAMRVALDDSDLLRRFAAETGGARR